MTKVASSAKFPTAAMDVAGMTALREMMREEAQIIHGEVWFRDPLRVVVAIWTRMEKARG